MSIIDLGLDVPLSITEIVSMLQTFFGGGEKQGIANYSRIFGPQWLASLGLTEERVRHMQQTMTPDGFEQHLHQAAQQITISHEQYMAMIDKAGLKWGLIISPDNEKTAQFVAKSPERLKGMAMIDIRRGAVPAVRDLEYGVKELGMQAGFLSAFRTEIPINDPRCYPVYAKAVELSIPVFVYTAMNYRTDLPMDIAHPRLIDQIAIDFPELKLVASYGGWPWVADLVGIARRHRHVFINCKAVRPKYLAQPGGGWDMLMQFGNTLLQDQIVFASGSHELGVPLDRLVEEVRNLPLKPTVKEKWLSQNAQRLFEK